MPPYPNLVSDSILISDTIQLLQSFGGQASAVSVVEYVMKIRKPPAELAKLLVSDLVQSDPRLKMTDDTVEMVNSEPGTFRFTETEFVVFDLETTGAKCPPCRVTEIGAFRVKNDKIVGEFHTLVNPDAPIPPFITQLTGISNDMVRTAPRFSEIAANLLEFISDAVLVAHNAHFDMRFLNHEIGRIYRDYRVGNAHLCTVQLSRKLLPHITNHRLKTVAEYYSIRLDNHHRASDDAHATAQIFVNLIGELREKGIIDIETARKLKPDKPRKSKLKREARAGDTVVSPEPKAG